MTLPTNFSYFYSILLSACLIGTTFADTFFWSGTNKESWHDPTPWHLDRIPGPSDNVWLDTSASSIAIKAGQSGTINELILARRGNPVRFCLETQATLNVAGQILIGQYDGAEGLLELAEGALLQAPGISVALDAKAKLHIKGGELQAGNLVLGNYDRPHVQGILVLDGGRVSADTLHIGSAASFMDLRAGTLVLDGDQRNAMQAFIAQGKLFSTTAPSGQSLAVDYNTINPGKTTVYRAPELWLELERGEVPSGYVLAGDTAASGRLAIQRSGGAAAESVRLEGATDVAVTSALGLRLKGSGNPNISYRVNNGPWASIQVPAFANWSWAELAASIQLPAGTHTIELAWSDTNLQIDKLAFTSASPNGLGSHQPIHNLRALPQASAGGYDYGWSDYDNSLFEGLGRHVVQRDSTGCRPISHAPAPGVHPRVFFSSEDIPDIRNRLLTTKSGQAILRQIRAYTRLINRVYDTRAEHAFDLNGNRLIGNTGYYDSSNVYLAFINGDVVEGATIKGNRGNLLSHSMSLEALECLVFYDDPDPTGIGYSVRMQRLITALVRWAEVFNQLDDPGNISYSFNPACFGLVYDCAHRFMTPTQRSFVRASLAKACAGRIPYGKGVAAYGCTSNWTVAWTTAVIGNLAIEQEEGYDQAYIHDYMRVLHSFYTYGFYNDGSPLESFGKSVLVADYLVAFAKRGYGLASHPHIKRCADTYLPSILQPYGTYFSDYEHYAGGTLRMILNDGNGLKWLYPDNPAVDFVWRNTIETAPGRTGTGYDYHPYTPNQSYRTVLFPAAVLAQDYADIPWEDAKRLAATTASDSMTQRGLAILTSGEDRDAMKVQFFCRHDLGGHNAAHRGHFNLSALGRTWMITPRQSGGLQEYYYHNVPLIDGLGPPMQGPNRIHQPARITGWASDAGSAIASGDLTDTYNWRWSSQTTDRDQPASLIGIDGWEPVTESLNDIYFQPYPFPHASESLYDREDWNQPGKLQRTIKQRVATHEQVKRNVLLKKGQYPYLIVADHLRKSTQLADYDWLAQVDDDLSIIDHIKDLNSANYRNDYILAEPDAPNGRRLLLRILQNEGPRSPELTLSEHDFLDLNGNPETRDVGAPILKLQISSRSVEPKFKIMMYPHRQGDPLPVSEWDANRVSVKNTIGGEGSLITFNHLEDVSGITVEHSPASEFSILQPAHRGVTGTTPIIDWEDVEGADEYRVYLWAASQGVNPPATPVATVTTSQWTPAALAPATDYRVLIHAVNPAGFGISWRHDFRTISAAVADYQAWAANHGGDINPQLDKNTNGLPDLMDYFLGARLDQLQIIPPPTRAGDGRLWWNVPHNPAAQADWTVERSSTLSGWESLGQVPAVIAGGQTLALDLGVPATVSSPRYFYRLRVTLPE